MISRKVALIVTISMFVIAPVLNAINGGNGGHGGHGGSTIYGPGGSGGHGGNSNSGKGGNGENGGNSIHSKGGNGGNGGNGPQGGVREDKEVKALWAKDQMDKTVTKNKGLKMKKNLFSALALGLTLIHPISSTACDIKDYDLKKVKDCESNRAKDGENGASTFQDDGQDGQKGHVSLDGGHGGNGGNIHWGKGGNGGNGGDAD